MISHILMLTLGTSIRWGPRTILWESPLSGRKIFGLVISDLPTHSSDLLGCTLWGSTSWELREIRTTDSGSEHTHLTLKVYIMLISRNLGLPILDLATH